MKDSLQNLQNLLHMPGLLSNNTVNADTTSLGLYQKLTEKVKNQVGLHWISQSVQTSYTIF